MERLRAVEQGQHEVTVRVKVRIAANECDIAEGEKIISKDDLERITISCTEIKSKELAYCAHTTRKLARKSTSEAS